MPKGAIEFKIDTKQVDKNLEKLRKKNPEVDFLAKAKVGLQLLNNAVNGSSKSTIVPPKLTGNLQGSGSVFVGNKLVGLSPEVKEIKPNKNPISNNMDELVVGFNAPYSAKMHNQLEPYGKLKPGPYSRQSGNVQGHFLWEHLVKDGLDLLIFYGTLLKKGLGL